MQNKKQKTAIIFRLSAMGDVALLTGVMRYYYYKFNTKFIVITRETFAPLFWGHIALLDLELLTEEDLSTGKKYRKKCKELSEKYRNITLLDMHASTRSRILSSYWKAEVSRYNKFPFYRRLFLLSSGFFGSKKLRKKNVCQRYASHWTTIFYNKKTDKSINIPREELKPQIYLSEEEKRKAKARLNSLFIKPPLAKNSFQNDLTIKNSKKIIAIHPFATHANKSLDIATWGTLATKVYTYLQEKYEILWLGMGNLPTHFIGKSLVNQSSLRELCALLSACELLITGDSGPMHLANAVDCKILALFGPTCEEWGFFPVGEKAHILQKNVACRPCSLHGAKSCTKNRQCFSFTDEEIFHTIDKLL